MSEWTFFRRNADDHPDVPESIYSEREVRQMIAASVRNIEKAIDDLKRGKVIRTKYGTYRAKYSGVEATSVVG